MSRELTARADAMRQSLVVKLSRSVDLDIGQGSIDHVPIHAGSKAMTLPADPDFATFTYYAFTGALYRPPQSAEQISWESGLTTAFGSGTAALITEATLLIHGLFVSAEYTARLRTNSQFVYDIFAAYLGRLPDVTEYTLRLTQLDTAALTRSDLLTAFQTGTEFTDRITALTVETDYPGDLRNISTWSLIDGASADQGGFDLQSIQSERTAVVGGVVQKSTVRNYLPTILADPGQRIHPAPATLNAVFEFADGSFWVDPIIIGYADVTDVDAMTAKLNVTSDMGRDGLDVTALCSQRCNRSYKGPGCDSPDPSPTCSRIFDDDVNGCAAKQPAPQITDPDVTNNQPSFGGVPPMKIQAAAAVTIGVNGFPIGPTYLDPNDPILHRRPFDDGGLGPSGLLVM
jgi:hypothetical protein